jgi:hypothetical protein
VVLDAWHTYDRGVFRLTGVPLTESCFVRRRRLHDPKRLAQLFLADFHAITSNE